MQPGSPSQQERKDSVAQENWRDFDVMFLAEPGDTLVFSSPRDVQAFVAQDTIKTITEADVFDTLDFRTYVPGTPAELIEDRLGCIVQTMPLTFNKTVNSFINYFTVRRRSYTQTMLERKDYYFPIMEEALKKYGLPDELKYLSIVESGLYPRAVSKSGAVGLWQFMGPTGRDLNLYQDKYLDERMDPVKSTEAACKYLKFLYGVFNDWELSLAAYNCGPGSIKRTMNRTGGKTFWEIYPNLPAETRSYVPQFTAVVYAMHYARFHYIFPDVDSVVRGEPTDTVMLDRQLNLAMLAKHLKIDPAKITFLNPSIRKPISPSRLPFVLNLPTDLAADFREARAFYLDSSQHVTGGDEPEDAIDRKRKRSIAKTETGKAGKGGKDNNAGDARDNEEHFKTTFHKVRHGETLYKIADKENVTVADLRSWNRIRRGKVKPGQRLMIVRKVRTKKEPEVLLARNAEKATPNIPTVAAAKAAEAGDVAQQGEGDAGSTRNDSSQVPSIAQKDKPDESGKNAKVDKRRKTAKDAEISTDENPAEVLRKRSVRKGESLYTIARMEGCKVGDLRKWNPALDGNDIKVGQELLIIEAKKATGVKGAKLAVGKKRGREKEEKGEKDVTKSEKRLKQGKQDSDLETQELVREGKDRDKDRRAKKMDTDSTPKIYEVQPGDTLWNIAQKIDGVSVDDIIRMNGLKDKNLKVGMKLKVG